MIESEGWREITSESEDAVRVALTSAMQSDTVRLWGHLEECHELLEEFVLLREGEPDDRVVAAMDCFLWSMHLLRAGWRDIEAGFFIAALRQIRGMVEAIVEGAASSASLEEARRWLQHGAKFQRAKKAVVRDRLAERGQEAANAFREELEELYKTGPSGITSTWCSSGTR